MRLALAVGILAVAVSGSCSNKKEPPVAAHSPLADSADQVMYPARFNLTDQGLQRAHVDADTAYFFDDNNRMELFGVNATFYTVTGARDAVLTSRRGTTNTRSNNMIARKNVVVVSEDGRRLTTEELKYNQSTNQISSDSAFVMTEPNRRLEGVGFRSDPNMKNIQILSGAKGIARGVSTAPVAPAPTPLTVTKPPVTNAAPPATNGAPPAASSSTPVRRR
ncbi:MAG TPA: LPS export ABC transporter periplasmic protein LptC [Gemmatimonadaceae bacterium]|nr:LPS export ABC transporter periplasmic protein LptC [Gemmatimonadaceae bacterium]